MSKIIFLILCFSLVSMALADIIDDIIENTTDADFLKAKKLSTTVPFLGPEVWVNIFEYLTRKEENIENTTSR